MAENSVAPHSGTGRREKEVAEKLWKIHSVKRSVCNCLPYQLRQS